MLRQYISWSLVLALGIFATQLPGCQKMTAPTEVQVSGFVEHKGQPIRGGLVAFCPVDPQIGELVTAEIVNGAYGTSKGSGLAVGDYKIVVSATDPENEAAMMSGSYSTLETTRFEIDVTGSEANIKKNLVLED